MDETGDIEVEENVMTEKENKEAPFEVWLGNLREYTEGNLKGEWISFPQEEEALQAAINRIAGPDKDELIIMDISTREDCAYLRDVIGEWSPLDDLNTVAKLLGDMPHPAVQSYVEYGANLSLPELANLLVQEEEIPYFSYEFSGCDKPEVMENLSSEEKLGYTMLESNTEVLKMLESFPMGTSNVLSYIDVEAIGRDLSDSGDFKLTEMGYYDMKSKFPDKRSFTMEEIKEMLAEQKQAMQQKPELQKEQTAEQKPQLRKEQRHPTHMSPSL